MQRKNGLPVMEQFYTIQGEGSHQGKAAYFIRLAGCDVGCTWCDVKESWDVDDEQWLSIDAILETLAEIRPQIVVITGGEPLIYDLAPLTEAIKSLGISINIETSGVYPLSGHFDWICVSPKKFKPVRPDLLKVAQELKVIVYHKSDFEWAEQFVDQVKPSCELIFQPEWGKKERMIPLIVEYVKSHPKWRIQLQTHKYMNVP